MAKVADHLVHESEFRGNAVVERRASQRIVLCGLGALGSKVLDLLASQGYATFVGIDREKVEPANIGTQAYGPRDVGRMKAQVCARKAQEQWRIAIQAVDKELTEYNVKKFLKDADLVVDLFDNADSRNMVRDFCKNNGIACLHAGMSHDGFSEIEWNENYRAHPTPADVDGPCDYPLAANLIALTVGLTCEIINKYVDKGLKESAHFTLNDMHVHRLK